MQQWHALNGLNTPIGTVLQPLVVSLNLELCCGQKEFVTSEGNYVLILSVSVKA